MNDYEDEDEDDEDIDPENLEEGSPVRALYTDRANKSKSNRWFHAKISSKNADGSYSIKWEDPELTSNTTKTQEELQVRASQVDPDLLSKLATGDKLVWVNEKDEDRDATFVVRESTRSSGTAPRADHFVGGWANGEVHLQFQKVVQEGENARGADKVLSVKKPKQVYLNVGWIAQTLTKRTDASTARSKAQG